MMFVTKVIYLDVTQEFVVMPRNCPSQGPGQMT